MNSAPISRRPILIGSDIFERTGKTANHPMAWPKTAPTLALIRQLAWHDPDTYVEGVKPLPQRLRMFHDPDYVDAALDAETQQSVSASVRQKYGLGHRDTPLFKGVIDRAAMACGVAIKAAHLLTDREASGGIVHSPLGGAHHVHRAYAAGFGYFNDLVIGILALRDRGIGKIAYVDLDAHHGDGVETAFAFDKSVLTLSVHQQHCWPHTGLECDPAYGVYNFPVPPDFNDTEMAALMHKAICPILNDFAPEVIVVQAGADSLAQDAMMDLSLSNQAYFDAIRALIPIAPRLWVTGGGGYNPWAVARCWAGIWCVLNDQNPADQPPFPDTARIINQIRQWGDLPDVEPDWGAYLADKPNPGPVRDAITQLLRGVSSP
ncbi:acetoin utilization protein AcuC [Aestuariibius sp. HNIBRBA575]|uniref:acetoin utilization protein AcuC n=1 Tax=Aestuariibius sp. HNIBRBA575 TaxID=3233343 RepID=UPI0034A5C6A5